MLRVGASPSATALDAQAFVKAELGIKVQHQRLAAGNSVIEGLAPLSLYTAEELGNVTLVVTSARTTVRVSWRRRHSIFE